MADKVKLKETWNITGRERQHLKLDCLECVCVNEDGAVYQLKVWKNPITGARSAVQRGIRRVTFYYKTFTRTGWPKFTRLGVIERAR